jgi:DUF3108-like
MKNLRLIFIVAFAFISVNVIAQDCMKYFPANEGEGFKVVNYDKKGKMSGYVKYTVLENLDYKVKYTATVFSTKDDTTGYFEFDVQCTNTGVSVSMANFLDQQTLSSMGTVEMDVEGDYMEFPENMTAGMKLPDSEMKLTASSGGLDLFAMTVSIFNRKVLDKVTVETPMGKFECFKITQTMTSKVVFIKTTTTEITYFSTDIGFVKSESFNKKGKLTGYTVREE